MDATLTVDLQAAKTVDGEQDRHVFKSPRRVLLRSFLRSRERWKAKYMAQKPKVKRLRVQAADAQRARDNFRERAETAEAEVQQVRAELALAQARLAAWEAAKKKGA